MIESRKFAMDAAGDLASAGLALACESRSSMPNGDYYDAIPMPDGTWCLAVGVVPGMGLYPPQMACLVREELRRRLFTATNPTNELAGFNAWLTNRLPLGSWMSLFLAFLDPRGRTVRWLGAGHQSLRWRRGVWLSRVGPGAAVLGQDRLIPGELRGPETLEPGDALVLYTDGIPGAIGHRGEEYGEGRFHASIVARVASARTAQPVVDGIFADLITHLDGRDLVDGATCLVLRALDPIDAARSGTDSSP